MTFLPSAFRSIVLVALAMTSLVSTRPADAAFVSFNFSGTVNSLTDSTNVLGGAVKVGDRFNGTVTFDTATTGVNLFGVTRYSLSPGNPNRPLVSPVGMTVQIGSYLIQTDYRNISTSFAVTVGNNVPTTLGVDADILEVQMSSYTNGTVFGSELVTTFGLADRTQQVFSSAALPNSVSTSMFTDGLFFVSTYLAASQNPVQLISGTVDNLSPSAVPEPASLAMVGVGLVGLGIVARRRRA